MPRTDQAKKTYHKENLRRDLIEAGRRYVDVHGHQTLSIRMLAQEVGVSPGAPYHHFPDRRSLLLALAIDGFEKLLADYRVERGEGAATDIIKSSAMAFVKFALENPNMLELMYESELTRPQLDPRLQSFQERGHSSGTAIIKDCLPQISDKEASLRNTALWTTTYGLVSMINKGIIRPSGDDDLSIDEICEWVVERAAISAVED